MKESADAIGEFCPASNPTQNTPAFCRRELEAALPKIIIANAAKPGNYRFDGIFF